jgi:RNA polymerase sigma factor for flagellar operon FliA
MSAALPLAERPNPVDYVEWVRALAWQFVTARPRIDLDDATSDGFLGLLDAAARWDPSRGDFRAFVRPRIRGEMFDGARDRDWMGREPRDKRERVRRTQRELAQRLGREPDEQALADAMGLTVESLRRWSWGPREIVYTSTLAMPDGDPLEPVDTRPSVLDRLIAAQEADRVKRAVAKLRPQECTVLDLVFFRNLDKRSAGRAMGVAERTVHTHANRALGRLRNMLT